MFTPVTRPGLSIYPNRFDLKQQKVEEQAKETERQESQAQTRDMSRGNQLPTVSAQAYSTIFGSKQQNTVDNNRNKNTNTASSNKNEKANNGANNQSLVQASKQQTTTNPFYAGYHYQATNPLMQQSKEVYVASVAKGLNLEVNKEEDDDDTVKSSNPFAAGSSDLDEESYNTQYRIIHDVTNELVGFNNKMYQVESKKPVFQQLRSTCGVSFAANAYASTVESMADVK